MPTPEGRSGTLLLQSSGWSKFECKLERNIFSFTKSSGKKNEIKCYELTKTVIVREYPKNFFKCLDFPFSITGGDNVTHVFRAEKEADRIAWLGSLAAHTTCYHVLAAHWATKCPKGAFSKDFKPRFFICYQDKISYYKEETTPEAGKVLLNPGKSEVQVLWHLPKRYTISLSPEPNAPLPLYMCFNLFEHYEKWMKILLDILQTNYTPPIPNPNLFKPGQVVKEGMLEKKGERNKAWQKRFFLLTAGEAGGESMLEYRKFNQFGKICGDIEISDRMAILGIPKDERAHQFALTSKINGRIFYLAASEENEKKSWIEMLTTVSRTPKFAFSICEGFLQKKGLVNKAYQERYFVLLLDRLLYFRNKRDETHAGEIVLSPKSSLCINESQENGFTLSCFMGTPRTYSIAAPDVVGMRDWMEKISAAIEGKVLFADSRSQPTKLSSCAADTSPSTAKLNIDVSSSSLASSSAVSHGSVQPETVGIGEKGLIEERGSEITEACVCGIAYRPEDKNCRICEVARPNPLNHANKASVSAARKRPVPKVFKADEVAVVRAVVVVQDEKQEESKTIPRGFGGPMKMAVPQKCSVADCGKWEFQKGLCKAHLSSIAPAVASKPAPDNNNSTKVQPVSDGGHQPEIVSSHQYASVANHSSTSPEDHQSVSLEAQPSKEVMASSAVATSPSVTMLSLSEPPRESIDNAKLVTPSEVFEESHAQSNATITSTRNSAEQEAQTEGSDVASTNEQAQDLLLPDDKSSDSGSASSPQTTPSKLDVSKDGAAIDAAK